MRLATIDLSLVKGLHKTCKQTLARDKYPAVLLRAQHSMYCGAQIYPASNLLRCWTKHQSLPAWPLGKQVLIVYMTTRQQVVMSVTALASAVINHAQGEHNGY